MAEIVENLIVLPKVELLPPETASALEIGRLRLRKEYLPILQTAQKIQVIDEDSYQLATQAGRTLQVAQKQVEELYRPVKQAFDAAKKVVLEMERQDLNQIKPVKDALAEQNLVYEDRQEKLRQAAERAARAAVAKAEEERRLAEAIELEAQGRVEEAAQRLEEPILPVPVIVQTEIGKHAPGSVRRESWKAQVIDFGKLVAAVAAGKVSLKALKEDQSWLDKQASAFREGLQIPGVTVQREVKGHFRS